MLTLRYHNNILGGEDCGMNCPCGNDVCSAGAPCKIVGGRDPCGIFEGDIMMICRTTNPNPNNESVQGKEGEENCICF